ncbi:hypothetical protein C2S53_017071 [Perilla frutescens var. hirtella]|uniref:Carrier domain-containing protein n=1 Tax=Perilla frutescens var. hirtella TaxID=608512 RepID=A0AAD4IQY1_PERFH|nr:hypothetical protein C2S53_017071 [Perilla frutescens var. hirtella]
MIRRLELEKNKGRDYDLSSMVFLMVAAEPVRQRTLKRFIELTMPYGLSQYVMAPGYGLAENCVFVSCAYGEGKPILVDWQGRVSCGYVNTSDPDIDIRIVEPQTSEEVTESGKEGEIWISSPSAGVGYWGREEHSRDTFMNKLEGRIYTRTGDLGRVIDGNLFITGRIKDLIIVAGRNVYSADVEKTVESSCDLLRPGCCAVIGVPEEILSAKGISMDEGSDQVGLVAIAEVKDGKPVNKDVVEQIKVKVAEEHGVSLAAVKLIKPRTISKTTSGKIQRFECLKQFTDEKLSLVPEPIISRRSLTPRPHLKTATPTSNATRLSYVEIVEYLKKLISEQTGVPGSRISTTANLSSYGTDSIGVVRAAQKLSDFLGVPVSAVDIFTATSIEDLATFSVNLLMKSQPQDMRNNVSNSEVDDRYMSSQLATEVNLPRDVTLAQQLQIMVLQFLALTYVSVLLIFPAYVSISIYTKLVTSNLAPTIPLASYIISIAFAPLAWISCIFSTCTCISLFGNSFLQPNYALLPVFSLWSLDYVKWWALYKAQEVSSKVYAVHLRGTVLLNYWFWMFGAKIGSSVVLDTIDVTDPALVSIGDGVVIAEGALLQSHEVRNGVLSLRPIRIGRNSSVGPYAVIQKGSVVRDGTEVAPLEVIEEEKMVPRSNKSDNHEVAMPRDSNTVYHMIGIYIVGFISSLSAAIIYCLYILLSRTTPNLEHFMLLCISGAFHWFPLTIVAHTIIINGASLNPLIFSISVAAAYTAHGTVLTLLTSMLSHSLSTNEETHDHLKVWLRQRLIVACHLRFAKLLSGTEAFCIYLRLLGARVGKFCSIRAINPILEPKLLSIGDGVHLGDFSRIITGFYSLNGFTTGKVDVQENCVVGSQSIVLPGATIEREVILGALSAAPINSVLLRGGVYIGSQSPIMIKNTVHELDERIEEMDVKYKKIVGNLAANLAATTLKVRTRYHGIGVSEKDASVLSSQVTLARAWHQTVWSIFAQPLMQTLFPYFLLAYVVSAPLKWLLFAHASMNYPLHWLLPPFWIVSGVAAAVACALAKWVLVGRKKDGGTVLIWSGSVFMDTVWQAFKTLAGEYFIETTGGSIFFAVWMKLMGAEVDVGGGVYVDSMGAALNPEMVEIDGGGCVGREALLFGHIYEGDGGKVKFGKIRIGDGGFVGSRAVAMPGVVVEEGGSLGALSLAMKGEVVRTDRIE